MAGDIRGITIEFNGDTTKLGKALRDVNKSTSAVDKELSKINKGLKFNPTSVELWRQKQDLLKDRIADTTKKLDALKQAKEKIDSGEVQVTAEEYRKLEREIVETESKLKSFKTQLQQVGNVKLKALGEQFKQTGQKMQNVGKNLTTKVSAPLAGIGVASLKAGMDFNTAMSQVAATSGKTVKEIDNLRNFAKKMGATTSFSATQAAEGLNYMALAGYTAEESMEMLPTVLDLAAAGAMDLGAASDMVTDAQTALGLNSKQTATLVDQMAKASSTTNTSVSQLGEAILKIGPTAKSMAGGTKELTQVLGLLADNGIKGSEAGTHLRNILLSLNTTKVKDAFHELGVEIFDAEGNMRSLSDIFPELSTAMDGLTSEERTGMLQKLFNKTDLAALNALLDTDAQRWDEVGEAIDNAGGSASKMANTQLDNLGGSLTLLKSALEGAGIAISDVLAPSFRKFADWVNKLVTKFNELSPRTQKIIVIVGAVAAAIGPLLVIIGVLASSIGSIISLIGTIGPLIGGVGGAIGGLMSGALLPVIAVIGAVIAIGVLLYKNWDEIKAKALEIKNAVVARWNELKTKVSASVTALKTKISTTWDSIKTKVKAVVDSIKTSVTNSFSTLKTKVSDSFTKIKETISSKIQSAKDAVKGAVDKIKSFFPISIGNILRNVKTPHFSLKWGSKDFGKLGSIKYPTGLDVSWWKTGGIFDSPSVIGVGEAGPEAVVPLDKLWDHLDNMSAGETNIVINVNGANKDPKEIANEVKKILIKETNQRRLAWQ